MVAGAPADATGPAGFGSPPDDGPRAATNTTLAVVATDAPISRLDLARMARMASNALARRIHPVHTPFDGDIVFAVSTAEEARPMESGEILALGMAAQSALEEAIVRAVTVGRDT